MPFDLGFQSKSLWAFYQTINSLHNAIIIWGTLAGKKAKNFNFGGVKVIISRKCEYGILDSCDAINTFWTFWLQSKKDFNVLYLKINVCPMHILYEIACVYRIIKMSSPNINNIILVGCIVVYLTVFLQELDSSTVLIFCRVSIHAHLTHQKHWPLGKIMGLCFALTEKLKRCFFFGDNLLLVTCVKYPSSW